MTTPPASTRRALLCAMLVALVSGCSRGIEPYELFYESGERRAAGRILVDESGARRLHDRWRFWYRSGRLQCEGTFDSGGVLAASALLPASTLVPRAGRDGDWTTYSDAGHVTSRGVYRHGEPHGPWRWFHDDGTPKAEGEFVQGRKHGRCVRWHPDGTIAEDGVWENGLAVGRHRAWHPNGQLARDGLFEHGLESGMHERFAANGMVLEEAMYEGGLLDGHRRLWSESGAMLVEAHYNRGRLEGEVTSYHPTGEAREVGLFVAGLPEGVHYGFDEDGRKLWTQRYRGGSPVGERVLHVDEVPEGLDERVAYAELLGPRHDWSETGTLGAGAR